MIRLLPSSRSALLLTVLLGMAVVSIGFPLPRLQALQSSRLTSPPVGQEESRISQWEMMYPSFSLRDWSIQMSAPEFAVPKPKTQLLNDWLPISQSQMEELQNDGDLDNNSPSDWSSMPGNEEKRNLVVADDAAFRQKSKLLTAMERQKWLNSYMQKLLVVNSQ